MAGASRALRAVACAVLACSGLAQAQAPSVDLEHAQDATAEGLVVVETTTESARAYVEEPVRVRVRLLLEREFLAQRMLQPFQRELDVPVQLVVPWLEGLACTWLAPEPVAASLTQRASLVLGEAVASVARTADVVRDGRTFAAYELERTLRATCPGTLVLPAPIVRFASATRFDEDAVRGRVALDRRDAFVRGAELALAIVPLPEEGRPPAFGGAVGSFTLDARVEPRSVVLGESLKLELVIAGEGNLDACEPPRLDRLAGFHLRGQLDDRGPRRRTITYDLAPQTPKVREIPPIRFDYFDPAPPGVYRSVLTDPIAIEVRAAPVENKSAPPPPDPPSPGAGEAGSSTLRAWLMPVLVFVVTFVLLLVLVRSQQGRRS